MNENSSVCTVISCCKGLDVAETYWCQTSQKLQLQGYKISIQTFCLEQMLVSDWFDFLADLVSRFLSQ